MSSTMNGTPEKSGQTEQATPTAPASSQTTDPEQTQRHGAGAAMNWIVLLTATFCFVVARLLSGEAAATSASIQGVASVVGEASPTSFYVLDEEGIQGDWWRDMTVDANKGSRRIIDRFYQELQFEDEVLTHISEAARAVPDEGSGKVYGSDFPSLPSDSNGLEERQALCQLVLNCLSVLNQSSHNSRENVHTNFNRFQATEQSLRDLRINLTLPINDAKEGEPVQATSAGEFFQLAIDRLNQELFNPERGMLWKLAPAHLDPEQALFVRALHEEAAAAFMYDSVVDSAIERFEELSKTIKVERAWFETEAREWLESRSWSEPGCPTTAEGVQTVLEETAAFADKWRGKLRELYSN